MLEFGLLNNQILCHGATDTDPLQIRLHSFNKGQRTFPLSHLRISTNLDPTAVPKCPISSETIIFSPNCVKSKIGSPKSVEAVTIPCIRFGLCHPPENEGISNENSDEALHST